MEKSFRVLTNFSMSVSDPQLRIAQLESELRWAQLTIQVIEERLRRQRIRMLDRTAKR